MLRKVKYRAAKDICVRARAAIEDVLESLDEVDRAKFIEEMPELLEDDDDDGDKPPPAKKVNTAKAKNDAEPSPQSRQSGYKRRVKSAIETIRQRDRETGSVGSWLNLDGEAILQVVNEQGPPLKLHQISEMLRQADGEIRKSRKLQPRLVEFELPTGTEWIVMNTVQQSPRCEANRRRYEERKAAGKCNTCGKPKDIDGTRCSSCKEKCNANNLKRQAASKPGWTPVSLQQIRNQAFRRIKPIAHRQPRKHYIDESNKLVEQAINQIEAVVVDKSCRHKIGMVGKGGIERRNQEYAQHSSELKNSLNWPHADLNVVTFAEIGLAFGLREVFESESDNVPYMLGCYNEAKFNEDGSLIKGELYLRY